MLLKTSENPTPKSTLWRYAVCSHALLSLLHSLPSFAALRFRGKHKHPNSSAQDALAARPSLRAAGIGVAFALSFSKGSSNLFSPSPHRYANTRHPAVRYSAYVRQRPPLVLLCLLHLWDCWCAALGRAAEKQVFPRQEFCNVSTAKKKISPPFLLFLPLPCWRNPGGQQG